MLKQTPESNRKAILAYSQAIELLQSCPASPANCNSIGAAFMNRGQLLRLAPDRAHEAEAIADFESAIEVLRPLLQGNHPWARRNLIGSLVNLSNALLDNSQTDAALEAASTAVTHAESQHPTETVDFELAALAHRCACDACGHAISEKSETEKLRLVEIAEQHASSGLAIIHSLRQPNRDETFPELSRRLFHFGSALLALHKPEKLPAFATNHLETLQPKRERLLARQSARDAICAAIDALSEEIPLLEPDLQEERVAIAKSLFELDASLDRLVDIP